MREGQALYAGHFRELHGLIAFIQAEASTQRLKFLCRELLQASKKQNDVENEPRDTEHNERLVIQFAPSGCAEE